MSPDALAAGTGMPAILPADLSSATLARWTRLVGSLDRAGCPLVFLGGADPADPLDGLALAAHCAVLTGSIQLCALIDPAVVEPFTLARGLATLDHLAAGRAAWWLTDNDDAGRTAELVAVTRALLLSWETDALIEDHAAGLLSATDRVRAIGHRGEYFAVQGPLNLPRPPQGCVPLVAPGQTPWAGMADRVLDEAQMLRATLAQAGALAGDIA
jgi:alkanesulfonate monooxygenase SsuD/methylene tetrahydromethanopterin reductase-like flavin-dependent oxidoreductase (luciferase family)